MMNKSVRVMFYKGFGKGTTLADWLICVATVSRFSHVEIEIDGISYGSSPRSMRVQKSVNSYEPGRWKEVVIDESYHGIIREYNEELYSRVKGAKYDYVGAALSAFRACFRNSRKKYFCSEYVAEALGLRSPCKYSPAGLYNSFKRENKYLVAS
jgi:hypothetical protein